MSALMTSLGTSIEQIQKLSNKCIKLWDITVIQRGLTIAQDCLNLPLSKIQIATHYSNSREQSFVEFVGVQYVSGGVA